MKLITHQSHLDILPASDIKTHIQNRFNQLRENTDEPPMLVLVGANDDFTASSLSSS